MRDRIKEIARRGGKEKILALTLGTITKSHFLFAKHFFGVFIRLNLFLGNFNAY
jgi:hypothetical protein